MPTPFVPILDSSLPPGRAQHGAPRRAAFMTDPAPSVHDSLSPVRTVPDDRALVRAPFVPQPPSAVSPAAPAGTAVGPVIRTDRHPALAPLGEHLDDPEVTDIFINGSAGLWIDRGTGARRDDLWRADEEQVRDLAIALIAAGGRHLDTSTPCVDVRLPGMRVHAVLAPVSVSGTLLSVRIARLGRVSLASLGARGMFDARADRRLRALVATRANLLVTGAAGSGKTTLLAALLAASPPEERIVTIEDVAELGIDHPHHVALEARQANLEGAGAIDLARLVREALRMRPDRLVVGECRGAEVRELLSALNTGHDGGAGTLHANGLEEVAARLEALGSLAGLDDRALARQAVSAIDAVLHVERGEDGVRRLARVGRLTLDPSGRLSVEEDAAWQS